MPANLENSAVATGNSQFSCQSQRKVMPKNVQTITQLPSFHTLAMLGSNFSKLGFNSTWTENFHVFKLDLEKAEEPKIKLPTSVGSLKKQESSRKTSISALLAMPEPLTVWITTNWKSLQEMGIPDHWPASWEISMQVQKQHLELNMENRLVPNQESSTSRLYIFTLLI